MEIIKQKILESIIQIQYLLNHDKYFESLFYLLITILIATILDKIIINVLKRLMSKTRNNIDDKLIEILHGPLYITILVLGFNFAIKNQFPNSIYYLDSITGSVIVFYWAIGIFKSFALIIKQIGKSSKNNIIIKKKTLPLFDNLGKILIFIFSIYFLMLSWGIDVTAWLASAGIMSVVLGFAAKDTLGNLFAGVFIMADSPYKEGDYIILDTGERGYVTKIGIRSTRIQTRDDIEITIPNSVIATSKIVNESGGPYEKERIRINIDVAYGTVLEDSKQAMNTIAINSENVCENPKPRVRFRTFGESGLRLQLLAWIERPELKGQVVDELSIKIYNKFIEQKISIPFPQRTLHIKKTDI